MIKKIIKNEIRKTGMFKELEIENQELKIKISNLENENKSLAEKDVGYSLNKNLRGLSNDAGKVAILKFILDNVNKDARILDVGFGSGIYGKLLRAFYYGNIDGVDVYGENIHELSLEKIYDNIFIENILDFYFDFYDLIIMGDVLEHIELELAKKLLSSFIEDNKCSFIIVSIPFNYEQGELYGNPYEIHLQSEVDADYMKEHYSYLKLLDSSTTSSEGIVATYVWQKNKHH